MFETFPGLQSQCVMEPSQEARPPDRQCSTPTVGARGAALGPGLQGSRTPASSVTHYVNLRRSYPWRNFSLDSSVSLHGLYILNKEN